MAVYCLLLVSLRKLRLLFAGLSIWASEQLRLAFRIGWQREERLMLRLNLWRKILTALPPLNKQSFVGH